jgi:TPP-dependent pyruvate/acetoin dehydrogenase alpha subunit
MTDLGADLARPEGRYLMMAAVRALEERVGDLFRQGVVHGTAHLSIGQEACAVGAVAASRPDDPIVSNHRGHGHFLARTGDFTGLLAELLGRVSGPCAGRGGSQHVCMARRHFYGTNGITGGGMPLATGLALSAKLRGTGQVALCFFGDGATNQGSFHESLNMAAVWGLPVLYFCENNHYAMSMRAEDAMKVAAVAERAAAYGMPGRTVDGMDVEAVRDAVGEALEAIRGGGGPMLLEADCYRFCGHSKSDRLVYRTRQEEERWGERDPLPLARRRLVEAGASEEELQALERRAREVVERAYEEAERAPAPGRDDVLTSPYAEGAPRE